MEGGMTDKWHLPEGFPMPCIQRDDGLVGYDLLREGTYNLGPAADTPFTVTPGFVERLAQRYKRPMPVFSYSGPDDDRPVAGLCYEATATEHAGKSVLMVWTDVDPERWQGFKPTPVLLLHDDGFEPIELFMSDDRIEPEEA